jgi:ADP-ribose pyrophosphatase
MKKISEKILYKGKWLSLKKNLFINMRKQKVLWESIQRNRNCLAFGIIARLKPSGRYILIKQFRQAINNYVIGLPAGTCDVGSASPKALRKSILKELKEETGYSGKIKSISPVLKLNPALIDHDFLVVRVEVDEKSPENTELCQCLEPAEEIETMLVEGKKLEKLLLEQGKKGVAISSGMWFLACNLI